MQLQKTIQQHPRLSTIGLIAAGVLGAGGFVAALTNLIAPRRKLHTEQMMLDTVPVTLHSKENAEGPLVVLAHGFAASQQIMDAFAMTLAHSGYTTISFDFPGHGRNAVPLRGKMEDHELRLQLLRETLARVVAFARERFNHRPLALLGHSMGSAVVADYAQKHNDIPAVVGVSLVYDQTTPTTPRNLLVINGGLEKQLQGLAQKMIDQVSDGNGSIGVTYGDPQAGTGRRVTIAPGSEHIGVLFNPITMAETLDWLNRCFNRPTEQHTYLDNRLPWMGLLYLSAGALFWPFAELFRRRGNTATHLQNPADIARYSKGQWAALMWGPAVLTPVLLRFLPTERLLPILIGGSLASHFAIYGLLTAIGIALTKQPGTQHDKPSLLLRSFVQQPLPTILPALLMIGYAALMFGMPTDRFVLNLFPPHQRYSVVASVFAAMLPYFLADELLTRSHATPRNAYPMTKLSFMLSLALAIALNPRKLFFLVLVAPVFIAYFALYGTWSGLVYQRTGTPIPGALANTTIFAWTTAAIFPMIEQ